MSVYDFKVKTIDGKEASLADYKGKALLIVNTASQCGYTPQYAGLEALYERYRDRGFAVLGFPSNDFGAQEPGSNAEIKKFCELRYKTTFPLFSKIPVKGAGRRPALQVPHRAAREAGRGGDLELQQVPRRAGRDGHRALRQPGRPDVLRADRQGRAGAPEEGVTQRRRGPASGDCVVSAWGASARSAAASRARIRSMRLDSAFPLLVLSAERRSVTSWR